MRHLGSLSKGGLLASLFCGSRKGGAGLYCVLRVSGSVHRMFKDVSNKTTCGFKLFCRGGGRD